MAKKYYEEQYINNTAIAIKNKLPNTETFKVREFAGLIDSMESSEPPSKDVDFYDYNGKRLYSYTLEEVQELEELPPLPDHSAIGLTVQSWTFPLDRLKASKSPMDIGIYAKTSDDKCHMFIDISVNNTVFAFYVRSYVSGDITVDWGDGNTSTTESTGAQNVTHTYSEAGSYVVKFWITSDNRLLIATPNDNRKYGKYVHKMFLPNNASLDAYCLQNSHIEYLTIPEGITPAADHHTFTGMSFLKIISLPHWYDGGYWYYVVDYVNCLEHICVPPFNAVSWSIGNASYSLRRITEPVYGRANSDLYGLEEMIYLCDVASIGSVSYNDGYLNKIYMMCQTQVPTWNNYIGKFFTNGGILFIPASLETDWKETENWSTYADQIIGLDI